MGCAWGSSSVKSAVMAHIPNRKTGMYTYTWMRDGEAEPVHQRQRRCRADDGPQSRRAHRRAQLFIPQVFIRCDTAAATSVQQSGESVRQHHPTVGLSCVKPFMTQSIVDRHGFGRTGRSITETTGYCSSIRTVWCCVYTVLVHASRRSFPRALN